MVATEVMSASKDCACSVASAPPTVVSACSTLSRDVRTASARNREGLAVSTHRCARMRAFDNTQHYSLVRQQCSSGWLTSHFLDGAFVVVAVGGCDRGLG